MTRLAIAPEHPILAQLEDALALRDLRGISLQRLPKHLPDRRNPITDGAPSLNDGF